MWPARYIPPDHSQSYYVPSDPGSQSTFVPEASQDAALTSFAQLGAIRLGTERALISLFDRTHQHVVAEATPTLDLVGGGFRDEKDSLRLGCCVLPKEKGICHHVEGLPSRETAKRDELRSVDAFVVMDTSKHERFSVGNLIEAISDIRFYAAVPIVSPRGFTIGAYSVLDSRPRTKPPNQNELEFMKNMAAAVMKHLEMEYSALRNVQAERKMVGLGSFVEGRSTLRDSWQQADAQYAASQEFGSPREGQLNIKQQDLQQFGNGEGEKRLPVRERPAKKTKNTTPRIETENKTVRSVAAGEGLQDHTLSDGIKRTFSRAANLIRESIGAEGVLFLSADSERFGNLVRRTTTRRVSGPVRKEPKHSDDDDSTDSSGASQDSNTDAESDSTRVSECLGFSSSRESSIDPESDAGQAIVVPEPLFSSLIRRYPRGKIFSYNNSGSVSEDSEGSPTSRVRPDHHSRKKRGPSRRRRKPTFQQDAHSLISIFAGARNILLLPIWDSDKNRWFAGTLVWTNDPGHVFTFEDEITYISAFTNSIMAEIRRMDVEIAEKAKTNLVSSITHELRNPLHGILGTSDILSDTAMNALQHGMVHTIESCGRTLLDTINNLLDLTFIDKYQRRSAYSGKNQGRKRRPAPEIPKGPDGLKSKARGDHLSFGDVKLDSVLEEVTECVFAGYSFYSHPQAPPPAMVTSSSRWGGPTSKSDPVGARASQVTIIFDIQPDTEWTFYTHAGAWRRILMNIFGNALKYTKSGFIYLGLSSRQIHVEPSSENSHDKEAEFEVTLTVKDTGKGIGPKYLQEGLFTAFSQEDPLASGSGLGLSIVRQAVGFLGGAIEIESTQNVGTTLTIRTPLSLSADTSDDSSSTAVFQSLQRYTQDKTIGLLGFGSNLQSSRDTSLYSSLERLCRDWFGLEVANAAERGEEEKFDFYLAVQTELNCEDTEGRDLFGLSQRLVDRNGRFAPVVVICQSPEEAHSMFVAAKNRSETFYFEFISQPCGPRKLAGALDICMKRQTEQRSSGIIPDEPTHWVEMPDSSHLPLDAEPSEPPSNRLKISKRPTADTMGDESHRGSRDAKPQQETPEPSVLLVDDNDLNLQLLCAYTEKDNHPYMAAHNGAEAVEAYKADPGKYQFVIIGMFCFPLSECERPIN